MTRSDVLPIKRKPLTKWQFATLFLEQKGCCAKCGVKLEQGKTRDEHVVSLFGGGTNDLSNRQLWCSECVKPKNKDDAARHAKIKRLRGETKTGPRRKIQSRNTLSRKSPGYKKQSFPTKKGYAR